MHSLESALNDLAVIETTLETLALFPEDEELRQELQSIVDQARENLVQHLRNALASLESGANALSERQRQRFKDGLLRMATLGAGRQELDRFLVGKFFVSLGEEEARHTGRPYDPLFHYCFRPDSDLPRLRGLPSHHFLHAVFQDLKRPPMTPTTETVSASASACSRNTWRSRLGSTSSPSRFPIIRTWTSNSGCYSKAVPDVPGAPRCLRRPIIPRFGVSIRRFGASIPKR